MAMPTSLGDGATAVVQMMLSTAVVEPGFFRKELVWNAY